LYKILLLRVWLLLVCLLHIKATCAAKKGPTDWGALVMSANSQHTMQSVYAAIGDCADGKMREEDLAATLEQAGKELDEKQQGVVETLLNSK